MKTGKKEKKQHSIMVQTTAVVLCFVLVMTVFGFWLFHRMEQGVLEVCALQQDAYVQLVVDQINLKDNRNNEEIVTDILNTLDSSSNKYWTFSQDQAMLFVKDVLETNKYKGFTTATYYNSDSAKAFLDSLTVNRVKHAQITLDDKEYLASGVQFTYGGMKYKMCLLTNKSVFLDNNSFLEAETELGLILAVTLIIIMVVSLGMASRIRKLQIENEGKAKVILQQNEGLVALNAKLSDRNLHDSHNNLWKPSMLHGFLEKMVEREIEPVTLMRVSCVKEKSLQRILDRSLYMLDNNVLRFKIDKNVLVFVFVQIEPDMAKSDMNIVLPKDAKIEKTAVMRGGRRDLAKAERKLGLDEGTEHGA